MRHRNNVLLGLLAILQTAAWADGGARDQYFGYLDLHDPDRATGWFTVGEDETGRTWFWTPEGNAFFGLGVNKVTSTWLQRHNQVAWQQTYRSNFHVWGEAQRDNLADWGFNSIAYLSTSGRTRDDLIHGDPRLYRYIEMPFVMNIFFNAHSDIEFTFLTREEYLRERYPDVWSQEWIEIADVRAERVATRLHTSPYMIGYNMSNELETRYNYEKGDIWADYIIAMDADALGKGEWVQMMAETYGDIAEFNTVYADTLGWQINDFDELRDVRAMRMIRADAAEFTYRILDQYCDVASRKIRKYDQNHMILGTRLMCVNGHLNAAALDALAPYVDVFSFNSYDIDFRTFDTVHSYYDKPIMISETAYLGDDTGYDNEPWPRVATQRLRGAAYRNAITEFASRPFIVGVYWHAYYDHGEDGRWRNWGLIDPLTDLPYSEFLDGVIPTNELVFDIHRGEVLGEWWRTNINHSEFRGFE